MSNEPSSSISDVSEGSLDHLLGKRKATIEKGTDGKKSKIIVNEFVPPNAAHLITLLGFSGPNF